VDPVVARTLQKDGGGVSDFLVSQEVGNPKKTGSG